jgi:hypothetical protein
MLFCNSVGNNNLIKIVPEISKLHVGKISGSHGTKLLSRLWLSRMWCHVGQ